MAESESIKNINENDYAKINKLCEQTYKTA